MRSRKEHSYGIIPLVKEKNSWNVLLVQLHAGHWGFPKGHPDPEETPLETAQRELVEETGLIVKKLLSDIPLEETYWFKHEGQLIHKTVTYFLAEVEGKVQKMEEEVKDLKWVPLDQAIDHVTFDQAKNICQQALKVLKKPFQK